MFKNVPTLQRNILNVARTCLKCIYFAAEYFKRSTTCLKMYLLAAEYFKHSTYMFKIQFAFVKNETVAPIFSGAIKV